MKEKKSEAAVRSNANTQRDQKALAKGRLEVLKTYKMYVDGKFPRTESGHYFQIFDHNGTPLANICCGSRKDFREAVVAARKAFAGWSSRSAYNRSQILYRMAEMTEGRKHQFAEELVMQGVKRKSAMEEVDSVIDMLVYFSGWCDKFQQVFSSVNPVDAPYFNFSVPEPVGVVAALAPLNSGFAGFAATLLPVIAGGNTCVVLASEKMPLCPVSFAEIMHTSDVPAGVVNVLTGLKDELNTHFASHMDVNTLVITGSDKEQIRLLRELALTNVKRVIAEDHPSWLDTKFVCSPYRIMNYQEIKTTWHPVGI
jgi:acyl-CoA reductase-like NAD-dependent aldehyde dehydrogenase